MRDLDWEWVDCIPFEFHLMEKDVQKLFVRDILLVQVSKSKRFEICLLERQIRSRYDE